MQETKDVNTDIFQESNSVPVVVQFYADWCGPCRMMKPVIESMAEHNSEGRWKLAMVNIENHPDMVAKYQIGSIPTVVMFHQEDAIARFTGGKSSSNIQKWLDTHLPAQVSTRSLGAVSEHQEIDNALKAGDLDTARNGIIDTLLQQYQDSPLLKLLKAVNFVGKNNNEAKSALATIDMEGSIGSLAKKVENIIDFEDEDNNVHTPASSPVSSQATDVNATIDLNAIDTDLLCELVHRGINEVRNKQGATDLKIHSILTSAALDQNDYMIKFSNVGHFQDAPNKHTVRDRVLSFGGNEFSTMGENVQYKGFPVQTSGTQKTVISKSYHQTAKDIVTNWCNSPGHYRNLISTDYAHVGTAVGWDAQNAAFYATQVFGA